VTVDDNWQERDSEFALLSNTNDSDHDSSTYVIEGVEVNLFTVTFSPTGKDPY